MSSRFSLHFTALMLVLAMAACFGESTAPDVVMVQPGTTTRSLGPLYFADPYRAADTSTTEPGGLPFTSCSLAKDAGSIALVEFVGEGEWVPRREDCSGPYSGDVRILPTQVYGVAAGEPLPAEVELVFNNGIGIGGLSPKAGDVWLVTARQSEGQWFLTRALPVMLDVQGGLVASPPQDYHLSGDFPSDFYELSDRLSEQVEQLATSCPWEAGRRRDDADFREHYYNPRARAGSNCHPSDGPQQQNSSEIDEEDLPPNGGTDDSVQP